MPATLREAELIVGSLRGLEAWRHDGSARRLLSRGPALHPRWLDSGTVLVIAPRAAQFLSSGARFERVALADGRRTQVAELPAFACANGAEKDFSAGDALDLQEESDFVLGPSNRSACLNLMDRNSNMADLMLEVHVDFATRAVERTLVIGGESCTPPAGVKAGERRAPCERAAVPEPAAPRGASRHFPFDFSAGGMVQEQSERGVRDVLQVPGYAAEAASPSGRWLLLAGDESEGDYMHRSVVLLDRQSGELYPILPDQKRWPHALARGSTGEGAARVATPIAPTLDVVTETDVRWLGASEATELLVLGDLVVTPGVAMFVVEGQVAR